MTRALDRTLQNILTSADLPTLPVVASQVLELTARDEVPLIEVINLISRGHRPVFENSQGCQLRFL